MCKNHADLKKKRKKKEDDDDFQFAIFNFIIFYYEQNIIVDRSFSVAIVVLK